MARTDFDPITLQVIFEAQETNTPNEVSDEVRKLWRNMEFGNDDFYYSWNIEDADDYPVIDAFLRSRGITECLIHWWW